MKLIIQVSGGDVRVEFSKAREEEPKSLSSSVGVLGVPDCGPGASEQVGIHRHYGVGSIRRDGNNPALGAGEEHSGRGEEDQNSG